MELIETCFLTSVVIYHKIANLRNCQVRCNSKSKEFAEHVSRFRQFLDNFVHIHLL